jgi:hypothetical protein
MVIHFPKNTKTDGKNLEQNLAPDGVQAAGALSLPAPRRGVEASGGRSRFC